MLVLERFRIRQAFDFVRLIAGHLPAGDAGTRVYLGPRKETGEKIAL
jgi:hypothetical protein